jgi:hypothetical protein
MALNFQLFRVPDSGDPLAMARALWTDDDAEPAYAFSDLDRQRLANDLCAVDPRLGAPIPEDFQDDYSIDLEPAEYARGATYELLRTAVLVSPTTFGPGKARRDTALLDQLFVETLEAIGQIARQWRLAIYAPKLDRLIDPDRDREELRAAFAQARNEAATRVDAAVGAEMRRMLPVLIAFGVGFFALSWFLPQPWGKPVAAFGSIAAMLIAAVVMQRRKVR